MKKNLIYLIIIIVGLLICGFIVYKRLNMSVPPVINNVATTTPIDFINVQVNTDDWQTYVNPKNNFSFKYPKNFKVAEVNNPNVPQYENILTIVPQKTTYPSNQGEGGFLSMTCCISSTDISNIKATSEEQHHIQILNINGNKIIVEDFDENGIPVIVNITLIKDNKMFEFNVNTMDTYSKTAYEMAIGVIKSFKINTNF